MNPFAPSAEAFRDRETMKNQLLSYKNNKERLEFYFSD
jgi:hypothetical protein